MSSYEIVDRTVIRNRSPQIGPDGRHLPHRRPLEPYQAMKIYLVSAKVMDMFQSCHNLVDIHSYGKLRQTVSVSDLAMLEILRRNICIRADRLYFNQFDFSPLIPAFAFSDDGRSLGNDNLTEDELQEIKTTFQYLVNDQDVIHATMACFTEDPIAHQGGDEIALDSSPFEIVQDAAPYQVITHGESLYIKVEAGFLSHLAKKDALMAFFSLVLKSAYAILPFSTVNQSPIYRAYVKLLGQ